MRRTRLTLLSLSWALAGLPSCHGDGDPPGEEPSIHVGSASGPISDWPDQHPDAGAGISDPRESEPPQSEQPGSSADAGLDLGGWLPARDSGVATALDSGLPDLPGADAAVASAPDTGPPDAAADAGDAAPEGDTSP